MRKKKRMFEAADLAGVSEVVAIIWPDGGGPLMHSKLAKVSMWGRRRSSTEFPEEVTRLACGPIYSRREVAAWWERFQTTTGHLGAMRGVATRAGRIGRFCTCGATLSGRVEHDGFEALIQAWDRDHTGPGHRATSARKAAEARRRAAAGAPTEG